MDGLAGQLAAQGAIDELVLPHPVEPGEGAGHHLDLEVVKIMTPTNEGGRKAYQQLVELGFVITPYTAPGSSPGG